MAASGVEDKVKQIIVEQLGVDESEVTSTASFVDDLGADSLDTVELVMAFEEGFSIEIPDEDAGEDPDGQGMRLPTWGPMPRGSRSAKLPNDPSSHFSPGRWIDYERPFIISTLSALF